MCIEAACRDHKHYTYTPTPTSSSATLYTPLHPSRAWTARNKQKRHMWSVRRILWRIVAIVVGGEWGVRSEKWGMRNEEWGIKGHRCETGAYLSIDGYARWGSGAGMSAGEVFDWSEPRAQWDRRDIYTFMRWGRVVGVSVSVGVDGCEDVCDVIGIWRGVRGRCCGVWSDRVDIGRGLVKLSWVVSNRWSKVGIHNGALTCETPTWLPYHQFTRLGSYRIPTYLGSLMLEA